MRGTIIVAVDGGPASSAAVGWAAGRARIAGLDLELTTVAHPAVSYREDDTRFRPHYTRVLSEASDLAASVAPDVLTTTTLRHGDALDQLAAVSATADLLVLGSNRTGVVAGVVHGTLPLQLARVVRSPLVVVPTTWVSHAGPVVVGADIDGSAESAADFAAAEAELRHIELEVVRAWELPTIVAADFSVDFEVARDDLEAACSRALAEVADRLMLQHPELAVRSTLINGRTSTVMVELAKRSALTVVGTHRRGALAGFFLGSVGHELLMAMPGPIAIVPPLEVSTRPNPTTELALL